MEQSEISQAVDDLIDAIDRQDNDGAKAAATVLVKSTFSALERAVAALEAIAAR